MNKSYSFHNTDFITGKSTVISNKSGIRNIKKTAHSFFILMAILFCIATQISHAYPIKSELNISNIYLYLEPNKCNNLTIPDHIEKGLFKTEQGILDWRLTSDSTFIISIINYNDEIISPPAISHGKLSDGSLFVSQQPTDILKETFIDDFGEVLTVTKWSLHLTGSGITTISVPHGSIILKHSGFKNEDEMCREPEHSNNTLRFIVEKNHQKPLDLLHINEIKERYAHNKLPGFSNYNHSYDDKDNTPLSTYNRMYPNNIYPELQKLVYLPENNLRQYYENSHDISQKLLHYEKMKHEWLRIDSLCNFPGSIKINLLDMACIGFYYTGKLAECCCLFCGMVYKDWKDGDDPYLIHNTKSPNCIYIVDNTANFPISSYGRKKPSQSNKPLTPSIPSSIQASQRDLCCNNNDSNEEDNTWSRKSLAAAMKAKIKTTFDNPAAISGVSFSKQCTEARHQTYSLKVNQPSASPPLTARTQTEHSAGAQMGLPTTRAQSDPTPAGAQIGLPTTRAQSAPTPAGAQMGLPTTRAQSAPTPAGAQIGSPTTRAQSDPTPAGAQIGLTATRAQREPTPASTQESDPPKATEELILLYGINCDRPKYINYAALDSRIKSYQSWPISINIKPEDLARAGFFYAGHADYTRCFFCGIALRNWGDGDDPYVEHARWRPKCAFLYQVKGQAFIDKIQQISKNKKPANNHEASPSNEQSGLQQTGAQTESPQASAQLEPSPADTLTKSTLNEDQKSKHNIGINMKKPVYIDYEFYCKRLLTFKNWPCHINIEPTELATAGFLYEGYEDYTRCFFCGGGLRNWNSNDIPWVEHAKWFPSCALISQNKGQAFIDNVQKELKDKKTVNNHEVLPPSNEATVDDQIERISTALRVMNIKEDVIKKAIHHHMPVDNSNPNNNLLSTIHKTALSYMENDYIIKKLENSSCSQFDEDILTQAIDKYRSDNPQAIIAPYTESFLHEIERNAQLISNILQLQLLFKDTEYQSTYNIIEQAIKKYINDNSEKVINYNDNDFIMAIRNIATNLNNPHKNTPEYIKEVSDIIETNETLKRTSFCVICLENPRNSVFLPCGHLSCCTDCSPAMKRCPMCKTYVKGTVKVFLN